MKNLYLVTGNLEKVKDAERILGFKVKHISIDLEEIQEMDTDTIADHKAREAYRRVRKPTVIWDNAIAIDCLNGFPGPFIKWFWETVTLDKICQIATFFKNNKVSSITTLTYFDGKNVKHFHGVENGSIPARPRGKKGFGWDSIFISEGLKLTNAELDIDNPRLHHSNRLALEKLKAFLS